MAELDRPLLLALAALYELADAASVGPIAPSVITRALLAMVHARSNGDLRPYRAFWQQLASTGTEKASDGYQRSTLCRTHLNGIWRTLGLEPQSTELQQRVRNVRERPHPIAAQPDSLRVITNWRQGERPTLRDRGLS